MKQRLLILFLFATTLIDVQVADAQERQRIRDYGIHPGILPPGKWNAITDVGGVKVGHQTVIDGEQIRTGVTVILAHDGNMFRDRVPAAVYVGNGFGKALVFTQVQELGELETPIALTNTLSVFHVAHGVADYVLNQPGNEHVRSVNPVVGETNDGWLNDIRARIIGTTDVYNAIESSASGPVTEGNVGAGTGTRALGFKAGIGTSSRKLPENRGGYTVGVLVQSNFGGILTINGAPVGEELGNHYMAQIQSTGSVKMSDSKRAASTDNASDLTAQAISTEPIHQSTNHQAGLGDEIHDESAVTKGLPDLSAPNSVDGYDYDVDGSIMIIVATDAPITSRNLERLAKRAFMGIARVGGFASNGSGDYVIAFSTHPDVRNNLDNASSSRSVSELDNDAMTPIFLAALEATEEAILNSLFMAEAMSSAEGVNATRLTYR